MSIRRGCVLNMAIGCGLLSAFLFSSAVFGADSALEEKIKSLEQSVKNLEESNKALEQKAARAQDVIEIQNLQGRYEAVHSTDEWLSWMLFADRPDTSKEITRDKIIGFDNIKADYMRMQGMQGGGPPMGGARGDGAPAGGVPTGGAPPGGAPSGSFPSGGDRAGGFPGGNAPGGGNPAGGFSSTASASAGKFTVHPVATPVIVVADDGKTAKATFTSFGFEGDAWCYGKYANSYIKMDGKWYIWHMKWLRAFKTPYYKAWYDQTAEEIYEFTTLDENGKPKLDPNIDYSYLRAPGKKFETITTPKPYATWTKEDEDGGWWKRETTEP